MAFGTDSNCRTWADGVVPLWADIVADQLKGVELGLGNLHRNDPVQPRIPRFPHLPHPAFAQRREQFIGTKFLTGGKWHGARISLP